MVFGTKMITLAQNRIYATKGHNGVNIHLLPDRNEVKLTTVCLKLLFHIFCGGGGGILVFLGCLADLLRDITIIFFFIIIIKMRLQERKELLIAFL